jgi:type II secretory pathway pseudopilin PulG
MFNRRPNVKGSSLVRCFAFTLIELLSIAIIGILASLLPAL